MTQRERGRAARRRTAAVQALREANALATRLCAEYAERFPHWATIARQWPEAVALAARAQAAVDAAQRASDALNE